MTTLSDSRSDTYQGIEPLTPGQWREAILEAVEDEGSAQLRPDGTD